MNAGRELDALVAEKVMGWKWWTFLKDGHCILSGDMEKRFDPEELDRHVRPTLEADPKYLDATAYVPHYSTDIKAAWDVVEKEILRVPSITPWPLDDNGKIGWCCMFEVGKDPDEDPSAIAETAPIAICLAALKAVGCEVQQ